MPSSRIHACRTEPVNSSGRPLANPIDSATHMRIENKMRRVLTMLELMRWQQPVAKIFASFC
jgi:hypothetical protein